MHPLKYLPGRRTELLLATGLVFGMLFVTWRLRAEAEAAATIVVVTLEMLLPPALGVVAAGLLANDPALDLLLTVPQPAPQTLAQRVLIVLGLGTLLSAVALWLAQRWQITLPISGAWQLLIAATPVVVMIGLATTASLLRGRMLDGITAVLGLWGLTLLSMPLLNTACEHSGARCTAALASLTLTLLRPDDLNWQRNRLLWLGIGAALLALGIFLANREERLSEGARGGEA